MMHVEDRSARWPSLRESNPYKFYRDHLHCEYGILNLKCTLFSNFISNNCIGGEVAGCRIISSWVYQDVSSSLACVFIKVLGGIN